MPAPKDDREIRDREMTDAPPRHDEEMRRRIAARAYGLYLERGARHGQDVQDWLDAERQVLAETRPRPEAERRAAPAVSKAAAKSSTRTSPRPVAVAKPARRRTLDT